MSILLNLTHIFLNEYVQNSAIIYVKRKQLNKMLLTYNRPKMALLLYNNFNWLN